MSELCLRNRQRSCAVNLNLLHQFVHALLSETPDLEQFNLGIHLVAAAEITRLNETYLRHTGSTDVITFDHADSPTPRRLYGEIFVCADEAIANSRRFHTCWQAELVRYTIHGILHLRGYRDDNPAARRRMKQAENRLLRRLDRRFPLRRLALSNVSVKS